jgi:hypothetical protein
MFNKLLRKFRRGDLKQVKVSTKELKRQKTILRISIHPKTGEYLIEFGGRQKDVLGIVPIIDVIRTLIYEDIEDMLLPMYNPKKDVSYVG